MWLIMGGERKRVQCLNQFTLGLWTNFRLSMFIVDQYSFKQLLIARTSVLELPFHTAVVVSLRLAVCVPCYSGSQLL